MKFQHPILTNEESENLENKILNSLEDNYRAIQLVGESTAKRFLAEFSSILPDAPKILVLAGKGHNGADAIATAKEIIKNFSNAEITLATPNVNQLKPLTKKCLYELRNTAKKLYELNLEQISKLAEENFDLLIEGLAGLNFRPPARESLLEQIRVANTLRSRIKISMDIPAGAAQTEQKEIFRADITYSNAIAKSALFEEFNRPYTGRIRYVDIGFFKQTYAKKFFEDAKKFIATTEVLSPLKKLRHAISDKRSYGHLLVIAGSEQYAGAALLNVSAALRTGVGLVTALVPKHLVASFAAAQPSAIWLGCETVEGGGIKTISKFPERKPTAILAGSGLGNEESTKEFVAKILRKYSDVPRVLDADAINCELASIPHSTTQILTPHIGEFLRLADDASEHSLIKACEKYNSIIAQKAPITKVCNGKTITICTEASPVLARGGSGDILAGLTAGLLARAELNQQNEYAPIAASIWLGLAAQHTFANFGETALATSDILNSLAPALKMNLHNPVF